MRFTFEAHIPRTIFGSNTLKELPAEVQRLNVERVLLVTESTSRQQALANEVSGLLGSVVTGVCLDATMHTPEEVTLKALAQAKGLQADCLISLGGGSTIGLAKALSIRMGIPHIAVPTTYAGSEATPILGETVNGLKTTRSDPRILPTTIVYDTELTLSLPQQLTYTSGINAIAHCVEALYSTQLNPVIEGIALSGIKSLYTALYRLKDSPNDRTARSQALSGAWAAGICLGHVGMAIHHKLCHTLGGSFGLPHSETHTVILPHAIAYNASAAPAAMKSIQKTLDSKSSAARTIWDMEKDLGTVHSLKALGMKEEDLEKCAELASTAQYPNPAVLEKSRLLALLENAYHGRPPSE